MLFSPLPQNWQERQGQGCPHSGSLMLIREGGRGLILLLSTTWRIKSRLLSNWLRLSALSTTTSHSNHPVPVLACSESTHLLRSLPRAPRWGLGKSNRDKQPFPSVSDIQAEQQFQSKSRPFLLLSCSGSHTAFVSVLGIYAPSFSVQPQIHSTPSLSLKLLSKYGGKLVAPQGQ